VLNKNITQKVKVINEKKDYKDITKREHKEKDTSYPLLNLISRLHNDKSKIILKNNYISSITYL